MKRTKITKRSGGVSGKWRADKVPSPVARASHRPGAGTHKQQETRSVREREAIAEHKCPECRGDGTIPETFPIYNEQED